MPSIAYFGPEGTFTEQAARALAPDADLLPMPTIPDAVAAVRAGRTDLACVPVENSIEGAVSATMDSLAADLLTTDTATRPVVALAEHLLPIRFSVLVRPGLAAADVRTVASHPHALAQVQRWVRANLPNAEPRVAASTAAAAVGVVKGEFDAAVTAPVASRHYELDVLATGVADESDAITRFLLLSRPTAPPAPTGADRTSVILVVSHRPGELAAVLAELATRGLNLTRIESRPLRDRFGEYRFYLDLDGHIGEQRVADALAALRRRSQHVLFLGSYPKAEGVAAAVESPFRDSDYADSAAWVTAIARGENV
ncbi:prephenate dehydratase [Actinokineospora auranticolor]|uniref:Prephenate dehydratase n=1 Tax=Actinokineospora auranticolor TaxID=155976 RepID=A0A2S6GBR7_9PSEU|nr:prephenate dehydratase [Actinokineospora auranticolor]PPK61719.1 prephenate dehydratase [Actinokineospora auranticolor]